MAESLVDKFIKQYGRLPTERDPDYLEMLRMSKYRVLEVPDVQPGKCANCGSSKRDGRKYIDIGVQVDWYGAIFLCSHCLKEVARNVGLFEELEQDINRAYAALEDREILFEQGKKLQGELIQTFEGVKTYLDTVGINSSNSSGTDTSSSGDGGKTASRSEGTGEDNSNSAKAEQRATKPTTGSRPKDLLSLAEHLKSNS